MMLGQPPKQAANLVNAASAAALATLALLLAATAVKRRPKKMQGHYELP